MTAKRFWSTKTVERARQLYADGMPVTKITATLAQELGMPVSLHTVHHWIYDARRLDAVKLSRRPVAPEPSHRIVWPDHVVRRARVLRDRAKLGEGTIARVLATEMDPAPSVNVVREWIRNGVRMSA